MADLCMCLAICGLVFIGVVVAVEYFLDRARDGRASRRPWWERQRERNEHGSDSDPFKKVSNES